MLPDSDLIAQDAAKIRAHLAMLACRDVANVLVKHALSLAEHGANDVAQKLDRQAAHYRAEEIKCAKLAGIGE